MFEITARSANGVTKMLPYSTNIHPDPNSNTNIHTLTYTYKHIYRVACRLSILWSHHIAQNTKNVIRGTQKMEETNGKTLFLEEPTA